MTGHADRSHAETALLGGALGTTFEAACVRSRLPSVTVSNADLGATGSLACLPRRRARRAVQVFFAMAGIGR